VIIRNGRVACCCALLNRERLVANIANDMRLGSKHHVAALNRTFHFTVHNHALSSDTSDNMSIRRDDERSAFNGLSSQQSLLY
jgi:hypothetical protein